MNTTLPKILHMSHHLKVKESLDSKVGSNCHAMGTHHEGCMLVDKFHVTLDFAPWKVETHLPECD